MFWHIGPLLPWKILCLSLFLSAADGRRALPPPAQAKDESRRDRYGDPLPDGAIARLGTLRFRLDTNRVEQLAFAPDGKTLAVVCSAGLTLLDAANGKRGKTIKSPDRDITRLVYSPDGKRMLTYAALPVLVLPCKHVVQTWDVAGGRKITEAELEHVCWLGWSTEGEPRAACLGKEEIVYHELAAGRKRSLPAKHLLDLHLVSLCRCVAAKNLLVAGGANGAIHVWDLDSGKERFALQPGVFVISLALSADGRRLASVSRDAANKRPIQLWDTTTGKLVRTLPPGHQEVLFAPDGKTLAAAGGTEMHFLDTASGRRVSAIRTADYSFGQAIAFTPDGKTFATAGDENGAVQLWNVADGTPKPQPQGHSNPPYRAAFSPDGKRLATCAAMDGAIRIWDAASGEPLSRIHQNGWARDWARDCAFSADGQMLYSCWTDDKLYFHDAASGRQRHALKVEDPERPKVVPGGLDLHLSDDRTRLTLFHTDDDRGMEMLVTVWDTATRKLLLRRRRVEDAYFTAVSADGRTLAAAHAAPPLRQGERGMMIGAGPMHLEDVESGKTLLIFPSLAGQTAPLAFSPDGRLLISYTNGPLPSGQRGVTLRLWEVLTAAELRTLPTSFAEKAAFSPEGRLLAATTAQGELLLWDVRQAKEHQRWRVDSPVRSLTFSPDGRRLVSGLRDSTLLVWDVRALPAAPVEKLGAEKAARAWADLADRDAPRAFRARWTLASAAEEAMPLLNERLHPARPVDPQRLRQLLADLDNEQFTVRQNAQEELEKLGDLAEPALRKTLENKPTLEVRRRVQVLLDRLRGPVTQPELLRSLRAVAVLEDIGTPPARRLLQELAQGAAEARLTREAKGALRRLELRKPSGH